MSKIDKLTEIAGKLTEDQIDELIAHAEHLSAPFYDRVPQHVRDSIARGIQQAAEGQTVSLEDFHRHLEEVIAKAK